MLIGHRSKKPCEYDYKNILSLPFIAEQAPRGALVDEREPLKPDPAIHCFLIGERRGKTIF